MIETFLEHSNLATVLQYGSILSWLSGQHVRCWHFTVPSNYAIYFARSSVICHELHKYTFFYKVYEVTVKNVESKSMYYRENGDVWHLTVFPESLMKGGRGVMVIL
jgi:hypothetical protein